MCRRIAGVMLALVLLLVAAGAYVYYDVTRRAPGEPAPGPGMPAVSPPTPQETRAAEETAKRLARQAEAPSPGESSRPFDVRITEDEANLMLRSLPDARKALAEADVTMPKIRFHAGTVEFSARVPITQGISARMSASGRAWASDGKVAYRTQSLHIGSFPAPSSIRREVDEQLRAVIRQINRHLDGRVQQVVLTEGALVVRGVTAPTQD